MSATITSAEAAPPKPFMFENVGKAGTCIMLLGHDTSPGTRVTNMATCDRNDALQQWTRDPATGYVRNVSEPNYCMAPVALMFRGVGATTKRDHCQAVNREGWDKIHFPGATNYFESGPGNSAVFAKSKAPDNDFQGWFTPPVR
ncbi:hypothetical protein ABT168_36995 [Streptomyces sp. NPDC001793]|uniref:hypothetical protein n=1 Tax=Streptomyces sp. NPDC001793 TaxID=3154657 RepID=UPI0033259111